MSLHVNFWDVTLIGISLINLGTGLMSFQKDKVHFKVQANRKKPKVTVIARTWDDDHIVERFIKCVLDQDYPKKKVQIIIADDGSTDRTSQICKKYKRQITYVRSEKHHEKKAEFLNKVIKKHAKGEILVNTDIDAVMPNNWLSNLMEHFNDKKVHAVCGPAYSGNFDDNWITKIRTVEDFWFYSAGMWGRKNIVGNTATYGSNHAVRMKTLKKVGYYGTKTITEDAELSSALWDKGYKVEMCPKAYVLVESVNNFDSFVKERKRWIVGTVEAGVKCNSKRGIPFSSLFTLNALAGFISLIAFFLSNYPWHIFLLNVLAIVLCMVSFKSKPFLILWIPAFLVVGTIMNILVILYVLKDYIFGEGVKWVKVEGDKYHKGVKLKRPFEKN